MTVFWRLILAHLLADFTCQTDFINHWKRKSVAGLLAHSLMHPAWTLLLAWPYLGQVWIRVLGTGLTGWACALIIFATHYLEDHWRVHSIIKNGAPDSTLYFLWDQFFHLAVIFSVTPDGSFSSWAGWEGLFPQKWVALACLFVLATHASTVWIYFIEKDLYGRPFPQFQEKYLSMLERLVLAVSCLAPGWTWVMAVVPFAAAMRWAHRRGLTAFSNMEFYLGGAAALAFGFTARMIYYS